MNLLHKYILFCIIATLVNLLTQRLLLDPVTFSSSYLLALLFGTITGLVTKYFLDKNYIFNDRDNSFRNNTRKFSLYTINGIFTTLIFWTTESIFFFIYGTDLAREFGAVIGLSIGYFFKYRLDKKYVFQD